MKIKRAANQRKRVQIYALLCILAGLTAYAAGYHSMTKDHKPKEESVTMSTEDAMENKKLQETQNKQQEETTESVNKLPFFTYAMVEENGYLTVYEKDLRTVFLYTGIPFQALTEEAKEQVRQGKLFADEQELYSFLESYSS